LKPGDVVVGVLVGAEETKVRPAVVIASATSGDVLDAPGWKPAETLVYRAFVAGRFGRDREAVGSSKVRCFSSSFCNFARSPVVRVRQHTAAGM
jgi:hypothetical protein